MRGLLLAALLLLSWGQPAFAWGPVGHRVVARIAEARLTPAAAAEVKRLLALEGLTNLWQVAVWADKIRPVQGDAGPDHSIRLQLNHDTTYVAKRDCPKKRCVTRQITLAERALKSQKTSDEGKLFALKYLVHFVADVHQPLHASKDTGAWPLKLNGKDTTLHKVWDSAIVNRQGRKSAPLARAVDASGRKPVDTKAKPFDWALESRDIARDVIFTPPMLSAKAARDGMLDDRYLDAAWPIAERRLREAGHRLAATLNAVLR